MTDLNSSTVAQPATYSTFTGGGVNVFVAISLKAALKAYAKHGLRMNRSWTPTKMLAKASEITDKKFKGASKYNDAVQELTAWIEIHRPQEIATGNIR